ncbi:hypothetical protein PIROE2DRAFT_1946, partial [Piromyces sp. E2]
MIILVNAKNTIKFSLSTEQMNLLVLLSAWKKGDSIINLPLETLSNESNVTINRQPVDLPNKNSSNLQKVFDITPYCNEYKNELTISSLATQNYGKTYLFVVAFCNSKPIDQFLSSLQEVPMDEIKRKMFKKQTTTEDDDIISTSNALSLQCPVSLIGIGIPTKFKSCMHLNCVDASSMFQMYSHFSIWQCPILTISPEREYTYQQTQESELESDSESENDKK